MKRLESPHLVLADAFGTFEIVFLDLNIIEIATMALTPTAVSTAKMAMVRYWRARNAIAPSKIIDAISCMASVPWSRRRTS